MSDNTLPKKRLSLFRKGKKPEKKPKLRLKKHQYWLDRSIKIGKLRFAAWMVIPIVIYVIWTILWNTFLGSLIGTPLGLYQAEPWNLLGFLRLLGRFLRNLLVVVGLAFLLERRNRRYVAFWIGIRQSRMRKFWVEPLDQAKMLWITRHACYLIMSLEIGTLVWWLIFTAEVDYIKQVNTYAFVWPIIVLMAFGFIIGVSEAFWPMKKTRWPLILAFVGFWITYKVIYDWWMTVNPVWYFR